MASALFWTMYGLIAYSVLSSIMIFVNWNVIKIHFNLWKGNKIIAIWKNGNIITNYKFMKSEPSLGIEIGEATYSIDEKKGLRFKRLPVHIFDENNIAELDFSNKSLIYPPNKFDPVEYQKAIKRALASGVNDNPMEMWIKIGVGALVIIAGLCLLTAYFGYNVFQIINDSAGGVINV